MVSFSSSPKILNFFEDFLHSFKFLLSLCDVLPIFFNVLIYTIFRKSPLEKHHGIIENGEVVHNLVVVNDVVI